MDQVETTVINPILDAKPITYDITVMVDLLTKEDYLNFFEQVKYLRTNLVRFHFLLVKMVLF